jgi:hypothetical protein
MSEDGVVPSPLPHHMFVHAYLICLEWVRKGNVLQLFAPQCQTKQRERQANKTAAAADTFGSVAAARFAATAAPLFFFFGPFFVVHLYTSPSLSPLFFSKSNQIQANSHLWEVSCFCRRVEFVGHGESKHTAKKKRKGIENNSSNVNSNLPAGQNTRTHTLRYTQT